MKGPSVLLCFLHLMVVEPFTMASSAADACPAGSGPMRGDFEVDLPIASRFLHELKGSIKPSNG
jgi:hypothetical protein